MLTLQMTAGNNSDTIWCLRLRGEGSNLVTLGDFSASTGWTEGTGWTIGSGVALCAYATPTTTGTLSRSITTEVAEYVLEYEISSQLGIFTLNLDSSSGIVDSDIRLDIGNGKHSIRIKCNGGSTIKFTYTGLGFGETLTLDNVSLRKADNVVYLSTRDVSLDSTYDGQVLNNGNYLSEIVNESSIKETGGTGSVSSFGFSLSRYVDNTNFSSFFNNLFPATDGGFLVSRIVDFGVCWVGATADTDITWLFRGRIVDYDYEQRRLNFTVFQESEISNKEIPYYTVQKDFDNDISYFANAPEDSYGQTIPVLYGDLGKWTAGLEVFFGQCIFTPCIPVYKRTTSFIVCSHKVHTASEDEGIFGNYEVIFKYIDGIKNYMLIRNVSDADSSTINNNSGHLLSMTDRGSRLVGALIIRLIESSEMSDVDNVDNAIDQNGDSYSSLDAVAGGDNKLALRPIGSASTQDVGYLGIADEDVGVYFKASTDGGGNRDYNVRYYNNTLPTPAGDSSPTTGTLTSSSYVNALHQFGTNDDGKKDTGSFPWTIEEVCSLDYYIENDQTTPGEQIRVYYAYLYLSNIKVYTPTNQARIVRNSGGSSGGRNA